MHSVIPLDRVRTKTVATVGPATRDQEMLRALIEAGVDVFRVNMAHGNRSEHIENLIAIRAAGEEVGRSTGILIDLAGPKIRLGELFENPTTCQLDETLHFVRGQQPKSRDQLTSGYDQLIDELSAGDTVMLADGTVALQVLEASDDRAACRVIEAGDIRNRQGINLPGVKLSVPSLTEADVSNAIWAAEQGVDFVGLSFVRSPEDVLQLRALLDQHGSTAMVVAKIEKREALEQLDEIVAVSDAVMVARGDLGVEIDVAETPVAQKRIIATCREFRKPVIVATQMLDSMQHSRRPTRAEASDVANAILDGADACMLSGETAIGDHPRETVVMMNRIMHAAEALLKDAPREPPPDQHEEHVHPITSSVVYGAGRIAERLGAKLVVIATHSGQTARIKAKQRDYIPTVGVSDSEETLRRMTLLWGIIPLSGVTPKNGPKLRAFIDHWGKSSGQLQSGDRVVFVTGSRVVAGAHNVLVVHEVE